MSFQAGLEVRVGQMGFKVSKEDTFVGPPRKKVYMRTVLASEEADEEEVNEA